MISGWRSKTHIPCRVVNRHRYRHRHRASQVALVVKNPPAKTGDIRAAGSIPGLERSPEEGNGNPLQYSNQVETHQVWDLWKNCCCQ